MEIRAMQPSDWPAVRAIYEQGIAGVAEESVYVAGEARGEGVGTALLGELVAQADDAPRAPSFFADAEGRME
jgi:L-amino acid N-acyltransferase YncA